MTGIYGSPFTGVYFSWENGSSLNLIFIIYYLDDSFIELTRSNQLRT